jgi:hypothetical protein
MSNKSPKNIFFALIVFKYEKDMIKAFSLEYF